MQIHPPARMQLTPPGSLPALRQGLSCNRCTANSTEVLFEWKSAGPDSDTSDSPTVKCLPCTQPTSMHSAAQHSASAEGMAKQVTGRARESRQVPTKLSQCPQAHQDENTAGWAPCGTSSCSRPAQEATVMEACAQKHVT